MAITRQMQPTQNNNAGKLAALLGVKTRFQVNGALWGYVFALPWIIGLIVFWLGPIFASLYFSFTEYDIISDPKWVGTANYVKAFTTDPQFWPSLGKTFYFTALFVPTTIVGSLMLAMLLNQKLRGTNIFRTLFFIPHLVPAVAIAVVWLFLMQPRLGPINTFLRSIGVENPPLWLGSSDTALESVTLINVWAALGGNNMLIFLAALQGVPQDFYEAAEIDGASTSQKFWKITLPLISPSVFFVLILTIIAALKVFTTAMIAPQTPGGPSNATWFILVHIYHEAFLYLRMGYGSALSWVLAVILIVFTIIQNVTAKRWVYYENE